ncbi:RNA-dependent RNA polymerase [Lentinula edodes fusarivirus 1]|uniref:RNA-dependent RNA polymerase n=1 Tax=Lentinula edodes fusarivirus 1 TaxID=2778976 RepID=A0ABX6U8J0_9VIRU|nr:RNA-dependent RNA polymerase [Lentinula edodes fusarivirus 1]QOX06044.1 RNA-dependent RNA polymerase [Lentinula edodes fusarivirus 1]
MSLLILPFITFLHFLASSVGTLNIHAKFMVIAGVLTTSTYTFQSHPFLVDVVMATADALSLVSVFSYGRAFAFRFLRLVNRQNLVPIVDWCLNMGHMVYFWFILYGILISHVTVVALMFTLPLVYLWLALWILIPFMIIIDFSCILIVLDMIYHSFFGHPIGYVTPPRSLRILAKLGLDIFIFLGRIGYFLLHPREIVVSVILFAKLLVSMPLELLTLIFRDGLVVGSSLRYKHVVLRFFIGIDLVLFRLLNLRLLIYLLVVPFVSLFVIAGFCLSSIFGSSAFNPLLLGFLNNLLVLFGADLSVLSGFISDSLRDCLITIALFIRFKSNPNSILLTLGDACIIVGPAFNLSQARREVKVKLFSILYNTNAGLTLTPLYVIILGLFILRFCFISSLRLIRPIFRAPVVAFECLILFLLPWIIPDIIFDYAVFGFYKFLGFLLDPTFGLWDEIKRWFRFCGLGAFVGVSYLSGPIESQLSGGLDIKTKMSQIFVLSWVSMTRRAVLKFVEAMDRVRLPEMIQASYNPPDLDSIRSTYVSLQGMGFPVDQSFIESLERPENSSYLAEWGSWRNWMIGTSSFKLGFRDVLTTFHSWLPSNFFPEVPGYIHSATFTGVVEELTATARYWSGNELDHLPDGSDLDDLVNDVWVGVKAQYDGSQLSTFEEVYSKWTKRFNMGYGFGTEGRNKRLKQLTRQAVIDAMGGKKPFLDAWGRVFYNAQKLLMPSPVFTKWETLKLKKALSRSVRTVVGSAFTHHVMTTVFNFKPNHNYHPWETPSKVGMPINGQNYNRLWESLMRHEKVWAGDMTAFDSTQAPIILQVCAEIRKKGYVLHRDYDRICQLIDISYQMLRDQPMGFKNFGDIAIKHQGATTGHSSTTPDNTIMLLVNYMYAWRRVTGLRAREFFNFNTLVNFGDDHCLGYDPVFGWTPEAAVKAMAELGTIMRDEAPGQTSLPVEGKLPPGKSDFREQDFAFLSKMPLPLDANIRSELIAAGVTCRLSFATCHDKRRLLGKIKGQVLKAKGANLPASYDALLSYMYLCAHHHDVYEEIAKKSQAMYLRVINQVKKSGGSIKKIQRPPSYNTVLRTWYSSEPFPYKNDELEGNDESLDSIYIYSSPDAFGIFVRWVSDFPTLLSPRYKNIRWADWVQQKLADHLAWPLNFVAAANGVSLDIMSAKLLLSRTPYSFLRNEAIVINDHDPRAFGRNLVRHWLYLGLSRVFTYRKAFSPLDLIRLFDSFWINLVFIVTGRVTQVAVELDLHILDTLVILVLSNLHIEIPFPPVLIDLLSPSILIARIITYVLSWFQPAGSIDFQNFDEQVRHLRQRPDASFVLSAPTGVGKSTRLMNRVQEMMQCRLTVIVPRQAVVLNVGKYMQSLYPNSGIGMSCDGETCLATDRIVYCTAQSFFSNPLLRSPDRLFVLDEAHIFEPHYITLRRFLDNPALKRIFVTATPLNDFNLPILVLPAVSSFSIIEKTVEDTTMDNYLKACSGFANDRLSFEKILIFVPTLAMMDKLAMRIRHRICRISSKHRIIDPTATVFLTTSVTDAGVTIPDVGFVLSPDIDIGVSEMISEEDEPHMVTYFFKISEQTIRQRRGRTGRTCDGVFLLFTISDLPVSKRLFTYPDFISGLAPASAFASDFFPPNVLSTVPEGINLGLHTYDLSKVSYGVLLRRFEEAKVFASGALNYWEKKLEGIKLNRPSMRMVPNEPDALPIDDWKYSKVPEDADPISPPPPVVPVQNQPVALTRINVSGRGLLCGAECVRGLVFTHSHVLFSTNMMADLLSSMSHFRDENEFYFDDVRDLLYFGFHIRVTLISPQAPNYAHPYNMDGPLPEGYHEATLWLTHGHYNYLGVPVSGPENDANIGQFLDPNYLVGRHL